MSDKRAMYAIGAIAATFALVLGLITAVPASTVTSYTAAMPMLGHAEVVLKDKDGNIKAYQQSDNVIPVNAQDCSADGLFGSGTFTPLCDDAGPFEKWLFIAVGSSTLTATDTQTALDAELGTLTRTGFIIDQAAATPGPTGTGAMKTVQGTFTLTASATVAEVGLFDTDVGPDMFSRINLGTPISAGPGDTVTITYKITVG